MGILHVPVTCKRFCFYVVSGVKLSGGENKSLQWQGHFIKRQALCVKGEWTLSGYVYQDMEKNKQTSKFANLWKANLTFMNNDVMI